MFFSSIISVAIKPSLGSLPQNYQIQNARCQVTGVEFDKNICPYKSAIFDFLQKLPFAFAQNVLGPANFALINPPFCGDNCLTDTRQEPAFYVYYFYGQAPLLSNTMLDNERGPGTATIIRHISRWRIFAMHQI